MNRLFLVCIELLVPLTVRAPPEVPGRQGFLVRITVWPRDVPTPILKYQLLPEFREMNPGNAVEGYRRCIAVGESFLMDKKSIVKREKWESIPLKELPLKELRDYGGKVLPQVDAAARLDYVDWQILPKLKKEGFWTPLPEMQPMRALTRALKVRFRTEIATQRYDDAMATLKTMLAMSRHAGEHPTNLGTLVGVTNAIFALNTLDEMIGQRDSPNLYWALTTLPRPFIDLRPAVQGERAMLGTILSTISTTRPMDEKEAVRMREALTQIIVGDIEEVEIRRKELKLWFQMSEEDKERLASARKRLIDMGLDADAAKRFPSIQILLLDEKRAYDAFMDQLSALTLLPYPEAEAGYAKLEDPRPSGHRFVHLAPAIAKLRRSQARLDQRLALLRTVEALRLHAARHAGKFPAKLAEIEVLVPDDPVSGKPFRYAVEEGKAILRGAPTKVDDKITEYSVTYELTLRK
jgi:hypothetical protein